MNLSRKKGGQKLHKKIIAGALTGSMLMGLFGNMTMSYADDTQYVYSQTGYRLYVDELDFQSGIIKGDSSEVQDGYKVTEITLPDGTTVPEDEVSYTANESGNYTFKIIYQSVSKDTTIQNEDVQTETEEVTDVSKENVDLPEPTQTATDTLELPEEIIDDVEQYRTDNPEDSTKQEVQQETEEVTLTVTLPENKEESQEAETEQDETTSLPQASISQVSKVQTQAAAAPQIESRIGGYDYSTQKKWNTSDFPTKAMGAATGHLKESSSNRPQGGVFMSDINITNTNDPTNGAKFRFGQRLVTSNDYYWLQQGLAISNITFDFRKDFLLKGEIELGDAFLTSRYSDADIPADGGVTISFVPGNTVNDAKTRANGTYSPAYRLGAYNTLKNSLICEFDTSSDDYYSVNDTTKNFTLYKEHYQSVGDYKYASQGNAYESVNGLRIHYASVGGEGYSTQLDEKYPALAHIGISTTDGNAQTIEKESSGRVNLSKQFQSDLVPYEINYDANNKQVTFKISNNNGDRTISMRIDNLYTRLSNNSQISNMKLAFTFGAAYVHSNDFKNTNNGYFGTSAHPGDGQIDIYAKELYVSPNLNKSKTKIGWATSGTSTDGITKNEAYNSQKTYTDRQYWPVAGDRIFATLNFKPVTSVNPQPNGTNPGKLTNLKIKDLKIVNNSGGTINIGGGSVTSSIYYAYGSSGFKQYSNGTINITNNDYLYLRLQLNLPKITNDVEEYYVTGNFSMDYTVGSSKVTYEIPIMSENGGKIPVSRNPKIIDYNGQKYSSSPRIIKSGTKVLKNITNAGNQNSGGDDSSLHYGVGYQPFSTKNYFSIYQSRNESDIKSVIYKYASMSNLSNVISANITSNNDASLSLDASTDTRYIVEYDIQDSKYSKDQSLTNNADRGKVTGHRVIWASGNVEISNGYEFYAQQNVTMPKADFDGFTSATDRGDYYREIAKAAGVKIFKTANKNFTDIINGNYTASSGLSGNGVHTGVENALKNTGTAQDVTLQYQDDSGTKVTRTIKLTIQDDIPTVVAEDGSIKDMTSEKIIFNGENFTVSGTFKLKKSDGAFMNYDNLQDKSKVKVALYKKNPAGKNYSDKFYRWVAGSQTDLDGQDTVNGARVDKVKVPAAISVNNDGTFTVSFTLYNHKDGQSTGTQNWVSQDWDHLSEYRIYCWTESNGQDIKYDNKDDGGTDTVEINHTGSTAKAPSSTTKMVMITRDNGNLPSAMFEISNVKLNDDGTQLSDKRKTTTISLKQLADTTDFDKAEHDYYYEVSVSDKEKVDADQRPCATLTQPSTGKTFGVNYLRYDEKQNRFIAVTKDNLLLGSIAYPSNENSLPSYIRFGMRADRQTGLTSNEKFTGTGQFTFARKSLGGDGS